MNQDQTPLRDDTRREPAEPQGTDDGHRPSEGEASALARHRDPSLATTAEQAKNEAADRRRTGVDWVRPSELLASRSARVAGRGIDFEAELARRARRVPGQTYRGVRARVRVVSERARRLPPVSAFGRGGGERFSWVSRSGIGLG